MTEPVSQPTQSPSSPQSAPVSPKKRGWFGRMVSVLILLMVVLILSVVGGVVWLLGTENGLRFALTLPERLNIGVAIHTKSLHGTIWQGFQANGITVNTDDADVYATQLHFQWQAKELWDKHVHVHQLVLGDVHIDTKPTPPKPKSPPPTFPERISLPVTVAVDRLQVGKVTLGKQDTVLLHRLQANYQYHHQHLLTIDSVKTDWSDSHGSFRLAIVQPYALSGKLTSQGVLDGVKVDNQLMLSGSLKDIVLQTNIKGLGISLDADTSFHPFAQNIRDYIGHIQLQSEGINPRAFLSSLPKAKLDIQANVLPELDNVLGLTGKINLLNREPMAADKQGIPVRELMGEVMVNESGAVEIKHLLAKLMKQGEVNITGGIYTQKQTLNLQAAIKNVGSSDVLSTPIVGVLNGTVNATGAFTKPQIGFQLNTGRADAKGLITFNIDTTRGQNTLVLQNGEIRPQNGGMAKVSASLELFHNQKLNADISTQAFNPAKLYPNLPEGNINGDVLLKGEIAKTAFQADMKFRPSQLSGAALSGGGHIAYENNHLNQANVSVQLGNNVVNTQGSFGKQGDVLKLDINAPVLAQFGFGIKGLVVASGSLKNTKDSWTAIEADVHGQVRDFALPNVVSIKTIDFQAKGAPEFTAPLVVNVDGKGITSGDTVIDDVKLNLNGSLRQHKLIGSGSLKLDGKPFALNIAANGGLSEHNQWQGTLSVLDVVGAVNLRLNQAVRLEAGAQRVALSAAHWQALGGTLNLNGFVWDKRSGLVTKGSADNIHLSQLHNLYKPPIEHDLVIASDWDLSYSNAPRGYLNLRQQGGDMVLPTERKPKLELNHFVLKTHLTERGILSDFIGDTRYGKASGSFNILQSFGQGNLVNAPVNGTVRLDVEELNNLKNLLPVGQIVRGNIVGMATIAGVLSEPTFNGTINGENLYYRNQSAGIVLKDGSLKSHLNGLMWTVDALTFKRGGTATLSGSVDYSRSIPDVQAKIVFNHYQVLNQPNRNLTISGKADVGYDGKTFSLNGNLVNDEGKFGFQESSAPTLDDDVVVLGESKEKTSESIPFNMNLVFDLNDKFYFSGEGLNVTLGGKLTLSARPQQDITGVGSIHIVKGSYKAYGQDLIIRKGIISFVGPLSKPNLNIRAERRNSQVGAGVEVLGNLETPRITLVANEPMSEKDKLSWLILNRASSGSSTDEAALATAASAFLVGSLNDKVGLVDDFGLSSTQSRNAQTGEMNPAQQVITFGKHLTRNLYLGYEAGLQTPMQSVKLVYQLSKAFQMIARIGTESSGGEIKYVKRFDGRHFSLDKQKDDKKPSSLAQ